MKADVLEAEVRLWRAVLRAALLQLGLGSHERGAQVLALCTKTNKGGQKPPFVATAS